jgi:hypothetical protein
MRNSLTRVIQRIGLSTLKVLQRAFCKYLLGVLHNSSNILSSSTAPKRLPSETEQEIQAFCGVVRNFLNYVLLHSVCPEYTDNVMAARKICDLAETELWNIRQLRHNLPGEFNAAAATLFGDKSQCPHGDCTWEGDSGNGDNVYPCIKHRQHVAAAEGVFKTDVALEGSNEMFEKVLKGNVYIVKSEKKFVEVVQIDHADATSMERYSSVNNSLGVENSIKPLGKLHVKPWDGPGYFAEDMTDSEDEDAEDTASSRGATIETYLLEDYILYNFFLGMKFEATVKELNIGLKFIEEVGGIYCSFHTVLPNEKVLENWKEPGEIYSFFCSSAHVVLISSSTKYQARTDRRRPLHR